MAELVVVRVSLQIAWSLLSNRFAKKLENGSESDEMLRQLLLDKFQKLHQELMSLRRKELVAATSFMENGYELYMNDPAEAKKEFTKARDAAQMAFGVVAETADKLLATKIMLASAMHEFDNKTDTAVSLSLKYVLRLNSLPEITDASVTYMKKGLVGKLRSITGSTNRHDTLKVLSEINRTVWEFVLENDSEFVIKKWPSIHFSDVWFNPVYDLLPLREPQELSSSTDLCRSPVAMVCLKKLLFVGYSQLSASDNTKTYMEVINLETLEAQPLPGHSAAILALVAAHGKVFSASFDKSVLVWDGVTPSTPRKVGEHNGSVRCLATSQTTLFSGATDNLIKAWNLESCEHVFDLQGHQFPISLLAFSRHLFSYAPGESVRIWNVDTLEVITEILDPGNVTAMHVCVSSKLVFHCGMDLRIWNLGNVQEEGIIKGVGKFSVQLPKMKFVTSSWHQLFQYDLKTYKCLYDQPLKLSKSVDISKLYFNYNLGMLFLGGVEKQSRKGVVLCM